MTVFANEKYHEVVDVLDQLELWAREIYSKAGLCVPADPDNVPPGPVFGPPPRPDQPASNVPPVSQIEDPLMNVRIPCYGDQLTRVRLAGAKDLRAGCHTPQDRLDHVYPFRIVDWHSKRSFLKVKHHINVCYFSVVKGGLAFKHLWQWYFHAAGNRNMYSIARHFFHHAVRHYYNLLKLICPCFSVCY